MKLAFVTSLVPNANPDTGFEIANAAIVAALRERGHEVHVFGFLREGDRPAEDPHLHLLDSIVIENAVAGRGRLARWLAEAFRHGLPLAAAKLRGLARGRLAEAIRAEAVRAGGFDALVLNSVMLPAACPELFDIAPCVAVAHNVEHCSALENAAHATGLVERLLYRREARLLKDIETEVFRRSRFVWFLAAEDREAFGSAVFGADLATRSAVLPLVPEIAPLESGPAEPLYDIGLIGTWSWAPNRVGLEWFLKEVAPRLPEDITVGIAGRLPSGFAHARRNVALLGRVRDAASFLASCRVLALASRAGTGVQLKTLEAFGLGKPAVATSVSLRGFASRPANVRVADDGPAFAQALSAMLTDVRVGRVGTIDGAAFLAGQKAAMREAIDRGLAPAAR